MILLRTIANWLGIAILILWGVMTLWAVVSMIYYNNFKYRKQNKEEDDFRRECEKRLKK